MSLIKAAEAFLFGAARWKVLTLVFALSLVKSGIWTIPNLEYSRAIALDPFTMPFSAPIHHYLFWNWLGPLLAWCIGANGPVSFAVLHLTFALVFTGAFVVLVFTRLPEAAARTALLLFAILPVSSIGYFWVGPDALTLCLMLLVVAFPSSLTVMLIAGVLLGMQHFEQGFVAAGGLLLAATLNWHRGDRVPIAPLTALVLLLAIAAGKILLIAIFQLYGIEVNSGRLYWMHENLGLLLGQFFYHSQYVLWSALALGWIVLLRYLELGREALPFVIVVLGYCLLLPLIQDQTRVFAIVSFPLIYLYWLANPTFLAHLTQSQITLLALIWAAMPWQWVWRGEPGWSVLPYDFVYFFHELIGRLNVPSDTAWWPFS